MTDEPLEYLMNQAIKEHQFIKVFLEEINLYDNNNEYIYRGHKEKYSLKPSIGRDYTDTGKWNEGALKAEKKSLREFKSKSIPYLKHTPKSNIEWLALMQHHGCSTRLLDFTKNPLIALFFASDPSAEKDGEVICANYRHKYHNVKNKGLFKRTENFIYNPPSITERIIGQSGCFVFSSDPGVEINDGILKKITIKQNEKHYIRQELKTISINHSTLFPSIEGICKDLNNDLIKSIKEV